MPTFFRIGEILRGRVGTYTVTKELQEFVRGMCTQVRQGLTTPVKMGLTKFKTSNLITCLSTFEKVTSGIQMSGRGT